MSAGKKIADELYKIIGSFQEFGSRKPPSLALRQAQHIELAKYLGKKPEELTHFDGVELRVI